MHFVDFVDDDVPFKLVGDESSGSASPSQSMRLLSGHDRGVIYAPTHAPVVG